jgi:hypothetical protein
MEWPRLRSNLELRLNSILKEPASRLLFTVQESPLAGK